MVMRVTQGANQGGGLLRALGFPHAHQNVTKNAAQPTMNVSWTARNNSGQSGTVRLAIWKVFSDGSKGFVTDWLTVVIPAGGQVTVPLQSILPSSIFPTFGGLPLVHNCELRMWDETSGQINAVLVAVHPFVLTATNI